MRGKGGGVGGMGVGVGLGLGPEPGCRHSDSVVCETSMVAIHLSRAALIVAKREACAGSFERSFDSVGSSTRLKKKFPIAPLPLYGGSMVLHCPLFGLRTTFHSLSIHACCLPSRKPSGLVLFATTSTAVLAWVWRMKGISEMPSAGQLGFS